MIDSVHNSLEDSVSRHRFALPVVVAVLTYIIIEGIAFLGLRVLEGAGRAGYAPTLTESISPQHRDILERLIAGHTGYLGHDELLGWTNLPGGSNELYSANSRGIRSDHEYSSAPIPGRIRIAAFGDSFMHADDVPNHEAWSSIVEKSESDIEVLNFGVGGFGPDQAYLRYMQEGRGFEPDLVFIGMMSENINRIVNVYRPFYTPDTGNPLAKPYFKVSDGQLVHRINPMPTLDAYAQLLEQPVAVLPALGEEDFHYSFRYTKGALDFSPLVRLSKVILFELKERLASPFFENGQYRTDSDQYLLLDKLLLEFRCAALDHGSLPVTVLFPHRADVAAALSGKPVSYKPLSDELRQEGLPVLDLADAFSLLPPDTKLDGFVRQHYTGRGNELIATFIVDHIRKNGLDTLAGRQLIQERLHLKCDPDGSSSKL
jgi:hypothetical protein